MSERDITPGEENTKQKKSTKELYDIAKVLVRYIKDVEKNTLRGEEYEN